MLLIGIGIIVYGLSQSNCVAQEFRRINYTQVREEGGFGSNSLNNVLEIYQAGRNLTIDEVQNLVTSTTLVNLRILDLTNQSVINDDVIERLANNRTFARIMNIKLEGTNITNAAILSIAQSRVLGSVRDLPTISGRYSVPSSEIKVYVNDTRVNLTKIDPIFNFHIEYKPPRPSSYPWEPVDHGVKFVEIQSW